LDEQNASFKDNITVHAVLPVVLAATMISPAEQDEIATKHMMKTEEKWQYEPNHDINECKRAMGCKTVDCVTLSDAFRSFRLFREIDLSLPSLPSDKRLQINLLKVLIRRKSLDDELFH
jgi:hypothetical protein